MEPSLVKVRRGNYLASCPMHNLQITHVCQSLACTKHLADLPAPELVLGLERTVYALVDMAVVRCLD